MKISIGSPIFTGPYGGGNLFVKNLTKFLKEKGHKVVFNLKDSDIDLILITNPLKYSEASSFNHHDINYYLKFKNKNALVVHRINECDERKGTDNVNFQIIEANRVSDYSIFVSTWLQSLYNKKGLNISKSKVILSGSDENIFFPEEIKSPLDNRKFKLVTHHWSANWKKGFDVYQIIDDLLESSKWNSILDFTYIGNTPKDFVFRNSNLIAPKNDIQLGKLLRTFDGYITASKNEPSGNHHIEAAQSGLPILYLNSGGTPEYCDGFGVEFEKNNFVSKLSEFMNEHNKLLQNMNKYPRNASLSNKEYLDLFEYLYADRNEIISLRKKLSSVSIIYFYLINKINSFIFKMYIDTIKNFKKYAKQFSKND